MTLKKISDSILLCLILLWLPTAAFSRTPPPTVELTCLPNGFCNGSMVYHEKVRTFHYFMHGGVAGNLSPIYHVIFVFHDTGFNGSTFDASVLNNTFDTMADAKDFIVVYPDAYDKRWNFGPESGATDVDDVGFIRNLTKYFEDTHSTAQLRIYAAGMGNGGLMVYRLGCDLSWKLNAIAVVDATMPVSLAQTCKPEHPLPVLLFFGRNDAFVPLNKNVMYDLQSLQPIATLTAAQTFDFWAGVDQLHMPTNFRLVPVVKYDGTLIYAQTKVHHYGDGPTVRLYTIFGAGHTWPGGAQYFPESSVGKVTHNLEASPVIANFFYNY